jgi:thioredoxin-like negative regulator of GroEL
MSTERIARLEAMLENDPHDPFTAYALALEWNSAGETTRAISMLEHLRKRHPDYVPAYHQLGVLLAKTGDTDRARSTFLDGIEASKRTGDHHAGKEMQEALEELE